MLRCVKTVDLMKNLVYIYIHNGMETIQFNTFLLFSPVTHNTLLDIVYCVPTSLGAVYRSSQGQIHIINVTPKSMAHIKINIFLPLVFNYGQYTL